MAVEINKSNFPEMPNPSKTMAGNALLLFINYGENATTENPKWKLLGGQRNSPLSMTADEIDSSDKASDGWGETLQGPKSWSIDQESVYKVNDESVEIVKYAFLNNIPLHIMRWDKEGNAMTGFATVTEFSDDNPHDDVASVTISLQGKGAPEFKTGVADPRLGT